MPLTELQETIRSSGFYRNKGKAIHALFQWLNQFNFDYENIDQHYGDNLRRELLKFSIGSETADVLLSISLKYRVYSDSYTRRLYSKLGYAHTESYNKFKKQISLPPHFTNQDANEFHALLDNFGKTILMEMGLKNTHF